MKYRKKPVVIEAVRNERGNLKAVETFLAGKEMPGLYSPQSGWEINWGNSEVTIKTLEGNMVAATYDEVPE